MTKTTKKRQSPSVERQLALALVAVLEAIRRPSSDESLLTNAVDAAQAILEANGYSKLESIPTRVARIQGEIEKALETKNYDALPRLGQEMKRAEAGKPPLTTEKKARAPRKPKTLKPDTDSPAEPTERKTRKRREAVDGVMCKCNVCDWTGVSTVGSACPVDGYLVVAQEG